jgi:hypothetical protein
MSNSSTSERNSSDSYDKKKELPSPLSVFYFPSSASTSTDSTQSPKAHISTGTTPEHDASGALRLRSLLADKDYQTMLDIYSSCGTVINRCMQHGIELKRAERQAIMALAWRAKPVKTSIPRRNEPSPSSASREIDTAKLPVDTDRSVSDL